MKRSPAAARWPTCYGGEQLLDQWYSHRLDPPPYRLHSHLWLLPFYSVTVCLVWKLMSIPPLLDCKVCSHQRCRKDRFIVCYKTNFTILSSQKWTWNLKNLLAERKWKMIVHSMLHSHLLPFQLFDYFGSRVHNEGNTDSNYPGSAIMLGSFKLHRG